MIDRFRSLLDRPLDPSAARAVLVLASAIFLGFAAVVVLAAGEPGPAVQSRPAKATHTEQVPSTAPRPTPGASRPESRRDRPARRQDPQDRHGSKAARRAGRELRAHRALQHVPFRRGALRIDLVGAERGHAVLRVSAPNLEAARRGWRAFLLRYSDSGTSYRPRFRPWGGHRG